MKLKVTCTNCNLNFEKDASEIKKTKNHFCNNSCAASYNNQQRKNKYQNNCLECGSNINKKGYLYCNKICEKNYKSKKIDLAIENGEKICEQRIKKYLIKLHGNQCMECGWNKTHPTTGKVPIQLEHVDGNYLNNSLDNLKLLCPNCHSLTLTFGALNKNNGRPSKGHRKY